VKICDCSPEKGRGQIFPFQKGGGDAAIKFSSGGKSRNHASGKKERGGSGHLKKRKEGGDNFFSKGDVLQSRVA